MPTALEYAKAAAAAEKKGDAEAAAYFRSKYQQPEEKYDPTEGMSGMEKFRAGVGSGMVDAGRNIANMVLPKSLEPEWATDEAINEQRQTDEALMDTGAGMAGNIVGGAVATAVPGGAALKGAQAVGRLSQAGRALPRALQTAGRVAGGRAGQVGTAGAVEGAILGGPDNRLSGAAIGAGGGVLTHGVGRGIRSRLDKSTKKALSKTANRRASTEAQRLLGNETIDPRSAGGQLQKPLMDIGSIPASQSLPEGSMTRQVYSNIVANMPGSTKVMHGQLKAAQHKAREEIIGSAIPAGVPKGTIIDVGDNLQGTMGRLTQAWDEAFVPVEKMAYRVPKSFNLTDDVTDLLGKRYENLVTIPASGDVIDGKSLLRLRMALRELQYSGDPSPALKAKLAKAMNAVDDAIKKNLDPNDLVAKGKKKLPQGPKIFKDYQENLQKWGNYQTIKEAAAKAPLSEFGFEDIAKIAKRKAGDAGLAGQGGFLQEVGEAGTKALGKFPNNPNPYQTLAAYSLGSMAAGAATGGLAKGPEGAAWGGALAPLAILGGSRYLAKPSVQQRILGKQKGLTRKTLQKTLDKYRKALRRGGFATRQLGVAAAEDQFNAP